MIALGMPLNLEQFYQPQLWVIFIAGVGVGFAALFFFSRLTWKTPTPAVNPSAEHDELKLPMHDPFTDGSSREQRLASRRKGRNIGIDFTGNVGNATDWKGYVLDRSSSGLRVNSEQKVELGAVIKVRVSEKSQFMPWVDVEVKRCSPMPSGWELGCHFVRPPVYNVLLAFG